jgi:hypothetical protein
VGSAEGSAAPSSPLPTSSSGARKIDSAEAEPIDLLDTAGSSVAKRAAPVLAVLAVVWIVRVLLKRRKK